MASVSILSNVMAVMKETRAAFEEFPKLIDESVGNNAKVVLREALTQIDALIYVMPETPGYHRTKNLRRSNKIKRLAAMSWLVYNDADYASYVHDGTSHMAPRPWMQNAIDLKAQEMEQAVGEAGMQAFRRGKAGPSSTAGQQDPQQDAAS